MGCISSKILVTTSSSFRKKDFSKRNRMVTNGTPMQWELLTSGNGTSGGNDHKPLALFSENSRLQTGGSLKSVLEPTNIETINIWELMVGLGEEEEQKKQQIKSPVEFQTIGSLKEWLHGGRVDSAGDSVAPKCCNYDLGRTEEESIFNPKLVASFEEFMQQQEIIVESVLKQIEGNPAEITAGEISAEDTLPNLQSR